jgi:hypothetical protein
MNKSLLKIFKNNCNYHMGTSNLSIKRLETAKANKSYSDRFKKDSAKFYGGELEGLTEILHIDLTKMPKKRTLTISRSSGLNDLVVYFTQAPELLDYVFKKSGVKRPKDEKMAWIIAAALVHYGVSLPKNIDRVFKSKYYKSFSYKRK